MNKVPVFVLVTLGIGKSGEVTRRNVGVTFNIHEAETHAKADVANEFETFELDGTDIQQDADTTALSFAMRSFREIVEEQNREALL